MKPFAYFAPNSLREACALLAQYGGQARALAGGTDLLLKMKTGRAAPQVLVNIKRIPDLHGRRVNTHLVLGALTTLEELCNSPIICKRYPALAAATSTMASTQIRNLATLGGNLCNAAPSADLAPILLALDAVVHIVGLNGERRVALTEFFCGPGQTTLAPDELLVSVELPPPLGPAVYLKHAPREHMDIAVVGVGLALQMRDGRCDTARVALGAVAPTPMRARRAEGELVGGPLTPERVARAAQLAADEAAPIDDVRGSAWYRRRLVAVLTRRGVSKLGGYEA